MLCLTASPGENTPTADDYETIADQTQLGLAEVVSLASEETNPGECLPGDKDEAVSPAEEEKISSVQDREEPEGTEPLPVGSEESSELPSVWREESTEPSPPPTPAEDAGSPPPDPSEDSGLVEGSDSSVVEIVNKVHVTEEDHFIEGNICAFVNPGDQILPPETHQGGPLNLGRASRELLKSEFGPQNLYDVEHNKARVGKPQTHKSKL